MRVYEIDRCFFMFAVHITYTISEGGKGVSSIIDVKLAKLG